MESIASNQSLELFAQSKVITCSLDMLVVEAISLLKKGHPYAVVLNPDRIPQGLFNSQCLLSWLEFQSDLSRDRTNEKLADVDLQPLPSISAATLIDEFLARVSQYEHSASIWALVDRDSRYIGAIEVLPLVRQIAWQNLTDTARSLEQLRGLIEPLPLPLMIHNAEGHILGANQQWQNYLNHCIQQIPQRSEDRPQTYHCPVDGGAIRTWQVISVELSGKLRGLSLAIAQNITNQEQLATELSEQNASLVRLNRMKDEFLACITHELKTPLTSVIGMASLLETKTFGELTERQSRYVNLIHRSGRHLMVIVDNIVDLAKAETGQLELDPVTIALKQLCQQSIYQTQKLLQQSTWTDEGSVPHIHLDIDPSLTNIVADSVKVQQMLVNLLSNAFKFSEDNKQPEVGLTVRRWEGWIAFTVWDRGIGIPEEKQHLIFQKFQQLENTLTRRFDGTGLGLVLTRHLARLHGGDVTFVSQVGVGSQFTILLPPIPPRSAETAKVPIVSSQFVLVVDNAAEDIDRLSTMLTSRGYRVAIARTGTEALEKARRLQPSLILLSPDLPVLSGWDVLALLKQDTATKHIRVAMMVVSNGDRSRDAQQANDILVKPIELEHLNAFLSRKTAHRDPLTIICLGKCQHEEVMTNLQALGHRLLEADSVEQGEILTQIWHPNLVLLDCESRDIFTNLERIGWCHFLKSLPILIAPDGIDRCRLEFPKLDLHGLPSTLTDRIEEIELNRIVNQAVGYLHSPTVLVADFSSSGILSKSLQQYILMAGFHVQISHSHDLILQQLQSGSVDALLVTLHDQAHLSAEELTAIDYLVQIDTDIPIVVVDGREKPPKADEAQPLMEIATVVLRQPDAIAQLLPTLRQCLSLG